jgi:hypothetical protein
LISIQQQQQHIIIIIIITLDKTIINIHTSLPGQDNVATRCF